MGDRKFLLIIALFAVASISLSVTLLRMVLLDEQVHSDGTASMSRGGGPPLERLNLRGD